MWSHVKAVCGLPKVWVHCLKALTVTFSQSVCLLSHVFPYKDKVSLLSWLYKSKRLFLWGGLPSLSDSAMILLTTTLSALLLSVRCFNPQVSRHLTPLHEHLRYTCQLGWRCSSEKQPSLSGPDFTFYTESKVTVQILFLHLHPLVFLFWQIYFREHVRSHGKMSLCAFTFLCWPILFFSFHLFNC